MLPCRFSCAAAAIAARDGLTLREALELDLGKVNPSKFSTGVSSLAAFDLRSSPSVKVKEAFRLAGPRLALDSPSLESLSKRPGYRSRTDLVGLDAWGTARASPFSSMVRTTEGR